MLPLFPHIFPQPFQPFSSSSNPSLTPSATPTSPLLCHHLGLPISVLSIPVAVLVEAKRKKIAAEYGLLDDTTRTFTPTPAPVLLPPSLSVPNSPLCALLCSNYLAPAEEAFCLLREYLDKKPYCSFYNMILSSFATLGEANDRVLSWYCKMQL